MNQSLKTAVYGLAVADALGVPYEFLTRGSFKAIEMVGYGKANSNWLELVQMILALYSRPMILFRKKGRFPLLYAGEV